MLPPERLRAARVAVTTTFFTTGFALGTWLVNIPVAQTRTSSSSATLGVVLLILGAAAFAAMRLSGRLCSRYGSRRTAAVGAVWLAVAVNLPGLAHDPVTLSAALAAIGIGNGLVNVAMNAQAAQLEQLYRRPIMSGFHAFFSIGGAIAAVLSAVLTSSGANLSARFGVACSIALLLTALTARRLLPPGVSPVSDPGIATGPENGAVDQGAPRASSTTAVVALLAAIALMMMLTEGAAGDWSSLHAVQFLGVSPASAALTYGTFALAMTAGRLTADRVVAHTSPTALVRGGAMVACAGFVLVILSPHLILAAIGWALAGLGLAGIVPQLITAAGLVPGPYPERRLATVVSTGYLGLLAGPAIIGFLADATDLRLALVLAPVLCVITAFAAGRAVRTARPEPSRTCGPPLAEQIDSQQPD